ncbi:MAG: dehydrogenase E1 component subunit alpha/beta [Bacteroidia bacterium]|nr:dehydrogenase E1 component subunit alpha/beta [Bacteroidia bacterium]
MPAAKTQSHIKYQSKGISQKQQIDLYKKLLLPRLIEEKMLSLLRQGKISKWFSGIGQEAISVACTSVLEDDEWIFPMHRNLGVFTTRNIPLHRLFSQWQGKPSGFTNGRDRSFHFGTKEYKIWGMISHLGPQLSLASGIALAHKLSGEKNISIAFTGEGGTSEGEFHEALNVAAVWQLPVIFVVENNGYGLSTPINEQFRCKNIADKGIGYGMKSYKLDGNNILEAYAQLKKIAKQIRKKPEPVLIEFETFRMRGHEEASGTKYVPNALMEKWAKKDPLINFEHYLLSKGIISESEVISLRSEFNKEIKSHLKIAESSEDLKVDSSKEIADVFAHSASTASTSKNNGKQSELRFIDAISSGLKEAMTKYENTVLMGQDIGDYGGVFKITDGFVKAFGHDRVRNTPLCESAIMGIALGLSMKGYKSMVEMQFADFVTCGFNQIVNNLAKIHYRWGHNADVVVRMPCGGGVAAGPFHSQTNEAWFAHTPGLKIVYPSNPHDAKGLLLAAFEDPNPVMFFEHKGLYRTLSGNVIDGHYTVEIGKGSYVRKGEALSIITYGMGVHWATDAVERLNVDAEIVDLRSIQPLDYEIIEATTKKTNKILILHEDSMFGGLGGEISAYISEHLFEHLDGPVVRVASLDTPIPFAAALEEKYLAKNRLDQGINKLLKY